MSPPEDRPEPLSLDGSPAASDGGRPMGAVAVGLTLLTAALWGGTPVAVSFSVDTLPPIAVAALRFLLGAAFMLVWCRLERSSIRFTTGQIVPCLAVGGLLFLQIVSFNLGVQLSNSSHSTLLINTFVFWVVAIEHWVTRSDRVTSRRFLGLVLAAAGVALILPATRHVDAPGVPLADQPSLLGDCLLLISAVVLGVKIVYTKWALRVVEPGKLIFWHNVVGVVLFAVCSGLVERVSLDGFRWPAILGLLYQGLVVAGLCFAIQTALLKRHSASRISVFSFSTPLFGLAIAVTLRGDQLSPWLLVSAVVVAVGIWLVTGRE